MTGPDATAWSPGQASDSQSLPAKVQHLLVQRVGLRLAGNDWAKVEHRLRARALQRQFPTLADFCERLSDRELAGEIERIAIDLTPGETFFFRDHGHFDLLRFHLLPELIQARRQRRSLQLWSAGCSTGEEAYSLAMLLDAVLPDRRDWRISIVGSDINEEFLAKAVRGRYGQWSFRQVPARLQGRYFHREGDEWVLDGSIRRMVTFHRGNLVADPLPDADFREIDLILCRNVLIYFQPEIIRTVAGKLAACLAPGGFLVTGHTELTGVPIPDLGGRLYPEGVVYQRPSHPGKSPLPGIRQQTASYSRQQGKTPLSPSSRPAAAPKPAPTFEAAQLLANRGEYDAAEVVCRKAIEAAPLVPASHFLLAQLAQLQGDYRAAEDQLNRTLYLDSGCVAAYLELAALHERAGDYDRALARRRTALGLLRGMPAETRVAPFDANAGELAKWLAETEAL